MPMSNNCRELLLMSSEEKSMPKTLDHTIEAAEKLAKNSAKTFLKDNPNASKQEIFQRAFISGMAAGIEMLTYKEKEK